MKSNVRWNFTLDGKKDFLYDESRTIRPGTLIKKVLSISYFFKLFKWSDVEVFCFRAAHIYGRKRNQSSLLLRGRCVNSPPGLGLIEVLCHHSSNTNGWMLLKCINISSLIGSLQSIFSPSFSSLASSQAPSIKTHIYFYF